MNSSIACSSPGNCFFRLAAISVFPAWIWYSLRTTEVGQKRCFDWCCSKPGRILYQVLVVYSSSLQGLLVITLGNELTVLCRANKETLFKKKGGKRKNLILCNDYNVTTCAHLRWSSWPRTSVSKCCSSLVNCSCPSVIWSRATLSRLLSCSWPR